MEKSSIYRDYSVEEFVMDTDFRNWVVKPDEIMSSYWMNFQNRFPEKAEAIQLARQIVENLSFEERSVKPEEYRHSLEILKQRLSSKSGSGNRMKTFTNWWGKVAAILMLSIIILGVYQYIYDTHIEDNKTVRYIVPSGQKSNVILADGTSVWLNSGSSLEYSAGRKNFRKVFLKGEAFFDVAKDSKIPFLVETQNYTIKVYGTQFNVSDCNETGVSETILKEGAVSILINNQKEISLKPGQRFFLNCNKEYSITTVNPELYLCWRDNILRINNEKLEDLIIRMERWYGVNIHVDNIDQVKDLRYTLSIKTESLREMLELMSFVTPFKYDIDGEDVILIYK